MPMALATTDASLTVSVRGKGLAGMPADLVGWLATAVAVAAGWADVDGEAALAIPDVNSITAAAPPAAIAPAIAMDSWTLRTRGSFCGSTGTECVSPGPQYRCAFLST